MVQTYYQEFQIRFTCPLIPAGTFWSVIGTVLTVNVAEAAANSAVRRLSLSDGNGATATTKTPARLRKPLVGVRLGAWTERVLTRDRVNLLVYGYAG